MDENDQLSNTAFRLIYQASEKLKDEGFETDEVWVALFTSLENLMAADFEGRSDELKAHIEAQRDSLSEAWATWDT